MKKEEDFCPVCRSISQHWADKNNYRICRCSLCDYGFVSPRPSLDFLMDYYESSGHVPGVCVGGATAFNLDDVLSFERHFPNSTVDAPRILNRINKLLIPGIPKTFLDVGCGYGFFSKEAQAHGFRVSMLELAKNEREITQELTGIEPTACSFEDYDTSNGPFSVILMSQILEHALDIDLWIEKSKSMLVTGGVLCIAVPNFGSIFRYIMGANEPFITPPTHLNFFDTKSLSRLLKNHGFSVEFHESISRISTESLSRRLPKLLKPAQPVFNVMTKAGLAGVDALGLGMIINVYARKQ